MCIIKSDTNFTNDFSYNIKLLNSLSNQIQNMETFHCLFRHILM